MPLAQITQLAARCDVLQHVAPLLNFSRVIPSVAAMAQVSLSKRKSPLLQTQESRVVVVFFEGTNTAGI